MSEKPRLVSNPPNPFESASRTYLEESPRVELHVYEERAKSILSENDSPDLTFKWSLNPYRGCQHACAYCYARPRHQNLGFGAGTDFENKIVVKTNAPHLLREALAKESWKGESIMFSGDTDCYQPLEASYELTRRCLEACLDHENPVGIITKSSLIMRDAALLQDLSRTAGASVYFSIPFIDEEMSLKVEPGAPRPLLRLKAMERLAQAGIQVGVMAAPIIPGLNDHQIPDILRAAANAGATQAGFQLMRLPGPVQDVFFERIRAKFPGAADKIEGRIRETRGGDLSDENFHTRFHGKGPYWETIERVFQVWREKLGLNQRLRLPEKKKFERQTVLFS